MNVYLDDLRWCPDGYVLAKNYDECIDLLEHNQVEVASFDHDLGEWGYYARDGYSICKWLCYQYKVNNLNYFPKIIYLHSANPVGRKNMYELLNRYKPDDVEVYEDLKQDGWY